MRMFCVKCGVLVTATSSKCPRCHFDTLTPPGVHPPAAPNPVPAKIPAICRGVDEAVEGGVALGAAADEADDDSSGAVLPSDVITHDDIVDVRDALLATDEPRRTPAHLNALRDCDIALRLVRGVSERVALEARARVARYRREIKA